MLEGGAKENTIEIRKLWGMMDVAHFLHCDGGFTGVKTYQSIHFNDVPFYYISITHQ